MIRNTTAGALMGAKRLQLKRAGTIRRVVRVSGRFVCGLCRKLHDHPSDANECLSACWEKTLAMDPVVVRRDRNRLLLRCLFCARDYDNRSAVLRCADECKRSITKPALAESKLVGAELQQTSRRPVRKLRPVLMPVAPLKKKIKVASVAIDNTQSADVSEELVPTADAYERPVETGDIAAELSKEKSKPTDSGKKKKPSDIFYRDHANYVCSVCHAKYFTKVEVSNCYDSHE